MAKATIYDFIRDWFDFSFENPDIVTPTHTAMYLWHVELNNRMGWAEKFGSPARQTMDAIGLKSYNTYKKIFDQLIEWEFLTLITPSKNQYQANVVALSKFDKAQHKALDKALIKHVTKHCESIVQSTGESTDSIIRQNTNTPIHQIQTIETALSNFDKAKKPFISPTRSSHCPTWDAVQEVFYRLGHQEKALDFFEYWEGLDWKKGITPIMNFASFANRWVSNPISQQADLTKGTGAKVIMLHNMSGNEVEWSQEEYEQYCKETGSGYKFLRHG